MFGPEVVGAHWGDVAARFLEPTLTAGEWRLGERCLSMAESILPSGDGKILVLHDITSAQRMKEELGRSQRLAAMGEMAASLAHQLRDAPGCSTFIYGKSRSAGCERGCATVPRKSGGFLLGESIGRDVLPAGDLLAEVRQTMEPLARAQGVEFVVDDALFRSKSWGVAWRVGGRAG